MVRRVSNLGLSQMLDSQYGYHLGSLLYSHIVTIWGTPVLSGSNMGTNMVSIWVIAKLGSPSGDHMG
jgi:hypothetical protein